MKDESHPNITIRPLVPELLPAYLQFFDRDAFTDNPDWAGCYCLFFLADERIRPWDEHKGSENRAEVSQRIQAGQMHGFLAFDGEQAVGWCHAAPRGMFPRIENDGDLRIAEKEGVGSIVCFVIAPGYRGRGIAARLLDAACESFRRQGLAIAEAYPRLGTDSQAANYHGPLAMYRAAGFEVYRSFDEFAVVRKQL